MNMESTDQDPNVVGTYPLSVQDATALFTMFNSQLLAVEGRLTALLDRNATVETERWSRHDAQHIIDKNDATIRILARFERIEAAIEESELKLEALIAKDHDEAIIMDARVRPVRNVLVWAASHWKDIALLVVAALGLFAVIADVLSRYLLGRP